MIHPHGRRGAALVEAVVMLPVFVLLLLGARWLVLRHIGELRVAATARACAWTLASSGCREPMPPECAAVLVSRLEETRWRGPASSGADWLSDAVLAIPPVRTALSRILPDRVTARSDEPLQSGPILDRRIFRLSGRTTVSCNAVPSTDGVLKYVLDAATGGAL